MKRILLLALVLMVVGVSGAEAASISPAIHLTLSQAEARAIIRAQEPRMTIRSCHRLSPRHIRCLADVPVYGKYEIYNEQTGVVLSVEEIEINSVLLKADIGLKGVRWRFPS